MGKQTGIIPLDLASLQTSLQTDWQIIVPLWLLAYLGGSISSAILICKLFGYADPRTQGSNNPGATNVLRIGGKPAAALTLAGDVFKGIVPVLIGRVLELTEITVALAGVWAFLGHLFPVFFRFQGGKGVATAFGLLFVLHWPTGIVAGVVWSVLFGLLRISSVASISAFIAAPIALHYWHPETFWPVLVMSLVLIARHHQNIRKLLNGEELGFAKDTQPGNSKEP